MALFRRSLKPNANGAPLAPTPGSSDGDQPSDLRDSLLAVIRLTNHNSGALPGNAVVGVRRLTDTMREIIDTSEMRPLDVYTVITVEGTLNDYLPTTLRSYLAVDKNLRNTTRRSGRTPTQSLLEQIEALQTSADAVLIASRHQDIDALISQGTFLRDKYSGSDLNL